MKVDILTLFPEMFVSPLNHSILKRAQDNGIIEFNLVNIRDYSENKHLQVDDYPYGGGAGMVMKVDVLARALNDCFDDQAYCIYLSPQGRPLTQERLNSLAVKKHLVLLCGHYEGIDERVMNFIDEEISIGDYILTGGELPAMVLIDAVVRLIPGVLGSEHSPAEESFARQLLEYPQYTRPQEYQGMQVPEVLLSGHHKNIRRWRKKQSLLRTLLKRPDLLLLKEFDSEEKQLLEEILFVREK